MRRARQVVLAAGGFAAGMAVGVVMWSRQVRTSRHQLFSSSPLRRLAALGYLQSQPGVDTARLLRDYVKWEQRPVLRRRGEQALRRMERDLE